MDLPETKEKKEHLKILLKHIYKYLIRMYSFVRATNSSIVDKIMS